MCNSIVIFHLALFSESPVLLCCFPRWWPLYISLHNIQRLCVRHSSSIRKNHDGLIMDGAQIFSSMLYPQHVLGKFTFIFFVLISVTFTCDDPQSLLAWYIFYICDENLFVIRGHFQFCSCRFVYDQFLMFLFCFCLFVIVDRVCLVQVAQMTVTYSKESRHPFNAMSVSSIPSLVIENYYKYQ